MLIYTVICVQHALTWDLNAQTLESQHANLPAIPPCLCQ
jgi:hypothetical protein